MKRFVIVSFQDRDYRCNQGFKSSDEAIAEAERLGALKPEVTYFVAELRFMTTCSAPRTLIIDDNEEALA